MASQQGGTPVVKPSFAKVAAMAPPSKPRHASNTQPKPPTLKQASPPGKVALLNGEFSPSAPIATTNPQVHQRSLDSQARGVIEGIDRLAVVDDATPQKQQAVLESDGNRGGTDSTEDDQSHLSTSSTKGPNFDTKSMASVTTFAMDEKESLRPDDSASVQAADEEEHNSPNASGATSSQRSSDVSAAAVRIQRRDGLNGVQISNRRPPIGMMVNPPRFGDLPPPSPVPFPQAPNDEQQPELITVGAADPSTNLISIAPDDKLLEAMGTPKDRLLLLQLEERIIAFVTQSQEDYVDLPPQNSFGRLLAHKLADYYSLAHFISTDNSSVRLFRAASSALPTPLSAIASALATNPVLPTGASAVKIMRRKGLGQGKASTGASTAASSSAQSKATSESGAEMSDEGIMSPGEITPAKDKSKWTREQKEAHYKAARERIFGDFQGLPTSEANSTGEASASMSRSSSSSGKRKSHKQRTPKDDSFEARSQFIPGYAGMTYAPPQSQHQPPFGSASYAGQYGNGAGGIAPSGAYNNAANPSFSAYDSQPAFNGLPNYPVNYQQQYGASDNWLSTQGLAGGSFYGYNGSNQHAAMYPPQPVQSPAMNQYMQPNQPNFQQGVQNWNQIPYQGSFQQPQMGQTTPAVHWPNYPPQTNSSSSSPYQYGQLPSQPYGGNYSVGNQHPLPGSYNRSIFNPQTRSFVPANPSGRFNAKSARSSQSKSPAVNPGKTAANGTFELNRPVDASSPGQSRAPLSPPPTMTNGNAMGKPLQESLQKKWGTPAHLPKKPPPSQVPSAYDIDKTPPFPSQQPVFQAMTTSNSTVSPPSNGPLVVTGGPNAKFPPGATVASS